MNILFATDGSTWANTAGSLLTNLSLPADTRITVLSVVPKLTWLDTALLAEASSELEANARSFAVSAATKLERQGVDVRVSVRQDDPAEAILEQAEADGAELIVVGSHGRGAVTRFLLGSVSERVARYAHCSVLVVRRDALRQVIIGVDGSEASEHALDALARLPLPAGAELTAVHVLRTDVPFPVPVLPGVHMESVLEAYDSERHASGERIVRHAQVRLDRIGRTATTEIRRGGPAHGLITAAREADADLIVVGAANRSPLGRLVIGGVSGRVLTHAPCSVLIARSMDE